MKIGVSETTYLPRLRGRGHVGKRSGTCRDGAFGVGFSSIGRLRPQATPTALWRRARRLRTTRRLIPLRRGATSRAASAPSEPPQAPLREPRRGRPRRQRPKALGPALAYDKSSRRRKPAREVPGASNRRRIVSADRNDDSGRHGLRFERHPPRKTSTTAGPPSPRSLNGIATFDARPLPRPVRLAKRPPVPHRRRRPRMVPLQGRSAEEFAETASKKPSAVEPRTYSQGGNGASQSAQCSSK